MRLLKLVFIFTGIIFWNTAITQIALSQNGKPNIAVGPVAVIGDISEGERKIISTRFENKLSQHYKLISEELFEQAQEEAYNTLDVEQCTEDQCIRMIQEILQVERLIVLQIIREGKLTQLSVTLTTLEDKKLAEGLCKECDLENLYGKVDQLVDQIVRKDLHTQPGEMTTLEVISRPPQAEVWVDGSSAGKTPLNLKTTVGFHQVEIQKKGFESHQQSVTLKTEKNPPLDVKLTPIQGMLTITGIPKGATIKIKGGEFQPTRLTTHAPLSQKKLPVGKYVVIVEAKGYFNSAHSVRIKANQTTTVTPTLEELPAALGLSVTPPDVVIEVDGKQIGTNTQQGTASIWLPAGSHSIRVTHDSGHYIPQEMTIDVQWNKRYERTIQLSFTEEFLKQQRHEKAQLNYEKKKKMYRVKWIGSLTMGLIAAGYAVSENEATKEANIAKEDEEKLMLSAASQEEAELHSQNAEEHKEESELHSQNAQGGAVGALILFGLATWIWLDEPTPPSQTSWKPYFQPDGHLGVAYQMKW